MAKSYFETVLQVHDLLSPPELEELLSLTMAKLPLDRAVWLLEDWLTRSHVGYLQRKAREKWKKVRIVPRPTTRQ